jgi:RNA polymerase sigma factor (sigma-70 family)
MLGDRDVAEHVVMDAFEEAVKRWATIDDPGAYVRRSVMNKANTLLRRRSVERRANALLFARATSTALPAGDEWVARQPVLAAVLRLPPRQRAVVVLFYLEDLAVEDIATTLGCSAGAVKNRLSVARHNLRQLLEGQS